MHNTPLKIQASEARRTFFELLEKVQKRKDPIIIEKKGEPIAILANYRVQKTLSNSPKNLKKAKALLKRIRDFRKKLKTQPTDAALFIREMREERDDDLH